MEMRPRYRGRLDSSEIVYPRTKWSNYQNAPSDEVYAVSSVSSNEREIRDVVEEVRHELLHLKRNESLDSFELPTKEELMNADANDSIFWTPSLFDEESSALSSRAPPMRDFANAPTPILRNFDDQSVGTHTVSTTVGSTTVGSTTQGSIQSGPTVDTNSSDFGSSCFMPGLDEMANDAQEIFCCGGQMEAVSNTSNAVVETAATELIHDSILQQADSFFSDDQARSIGTTFSQVSQEFDMAGNRVVDLTTMISTENLCVKKGAVNDLVVVEEPETSTVPSEVTFKKKVLTKLNMNSNKKNKKRRKRRVPQEKKGGTKKPGMFGKLKGRFQKGNKGRS